MYKALKKFYCPLSKRRVLPGELIEIPEQYLLNYAGYVERASEAPKVVVSPILPDPLPEMTIAERPKKKKVKGNA